MINKLTWESQFFGFNIGRVDSIEINFEQKFSEGEFDLVYYFEEKQYISANPFSLEFLTSTLVDIKILFTKDIISNIEIVENILDFQKDKHDLSSLLKLAFASGSYSRYKIDINFPQGSFEKFYTAWVENSLKGELDDDVIVFQNDDNSLGGFVTVKYKADSAVIGLIAVDEDSRGKQIGTKLLNEVERRAKRRAINVLDVATQVDNVNACNFYIKNQFKIKKQTKIFHIWKLKK